MEAPQSLIDFVLDLFKNDGSCKVDGELSWVIQWDSKLKDGFGFKRSAKRAKLKCSWFKLTLSLVRMDSEFFFQRKFEDSTEKNSYVVLVPIRETAPGVWNC